MNNRNIISQGDLYQFLLEILPDHKTKRLALDVKKLRENPQIMKSHEAVYKWVRKNELTPEMAMALCNIANSQENRESLAREGRTPPSIQDFNRFVYTKRAAA